MSDVFDDVEFLSLSTLLRLHHGPQEPEAGSAEDEDSSDSDIVSVGSDNDSMATFESSTLPPKEGQLTKFLDHIAEVFAREKKIHPPQAKRFERRKNNTKCGRAASHVAATGFSFEDNKVTVYIAKNGGIDDKDETLARQLATWIRAIATAGRWPEIDKDLIWPRLLTYYRQRLDVYAAVLGCFSEIELTTAFPVGSEGGALARKLHSLSASYKTEASDRKLEQMITIAYQLRYEPEFEGSSDRSKRVRRWVCFLGRLRSAYEVFKETTLQFQQSFSGLKLVCLQAPKAVSLDLTSCEKRIQKLANDYGFAAPQRKKLKEILGQRNAVLTHCHAEVQILIHLESLSPANANLFPYIGCSRRSCWLCQQLISIYRAKRSDKRGFYVTRGCHGQIYPLWSIKLSDQPSDPHMQFYLATSLQEIRNLLVQRLRTTVHTQRPANAESSVNMTVVGNPLQRRALAKQRVIESMARPAPVESAKIILKDLTCSKRCLLIPAAGQRPCLVDINFYVQPAAYPGYELSNDGIPDFGGYWNNSNFERGIRRITMTGQDPPDVDGDYLLYWCRDSNLPFNRQLMSLLGIDNIGIEEYFWHGDVFITRVCEEEKSFKFHCEDVPTACLDQKRLANLFRTLWEDKEPENDVKTQQQADIWTEKLEADKELLLGRMSRVERAMLDHMPWMLDYLAISTCDDGAVVDVSIRESEEDPGLVNVTSLVRRTALEQRGWKGFSSGDL